ncbi:hypothetical protein, unknown function [Leishmania mexicana MHOM/GT/2001/U1103]|uniref:Uncharacterized protein n=1 Tax=Leishmania mexicana (strain MHOM/GT/2001/U1103) TaxID=929439 RepID=E9B1Z0_LEIMU|nr:hypothetical protein, unknown function [Leishmania mexicana MHOM/GT/2001/U1103]CBZ29247.1 hypothetical protein, unknown function [Leishmania mexicana MHOM/GT/2001/U1103]
MLLGSGRVADSVASVAATDSIGYPMEQPPASEGKLQPQLSKGALQNALEGEKHRRLKIVDVGGMVGGRRVARPRNESFYRGLAPSSRSTKKQLTAADEQLCKRLATSHNSSGSSSTLQHHSDSGVSSVVASRKVCNGSSMSLLSHKSARQQATEEDRDAGLAAAASGCAVVDLRESSAVVLQPLDTLQDSPLDEGKDHPSGKDNCSPSLNGDTNYPDTAAAAIRVPMLGSRGHPSFQQSSRASSQLSSHRTSNITAKPSFKGCSAKPQSVPGTPLVYADGVTEADERHRPIRRMSSSCDLSVVWIAPPLCERLRPGQACSARGNSMTRSRCAPSAGTPVAQARVPGAPCRPPSTTTPHKRQETSRARSSHSAASSSSAYMGDKSHEARHMLQCWLSSACGSFTHVNRPKMGPAGETRFIGHAADNDRSGAGGHQLPFRGQAARPPELATQDSPSTSSQREALSAVTPTVDEVLARNRADFTVQPNTPSIAAPYSPSAAYTRGGDRWAATPAHPSAFTWSAVLAAAQHPYYASGPEQQRPGPYGHTYDVAYHGEGQTCPAAEATSACMRGDGGGFLPALEHAKSSHVRPVGGLKASKWRVPVPPAKRRVICELLEPVVPGRPRATFRRSQQPRRPPQRYPQRPTGKLLGSSEHEHMSLAEVVADASLTQQARQQPLSLRRENAPAATSDRGDMTLTTLSEDEEYASARNYPAVAPPRTTAAADDDVYTTVARKRRRNLHKKKAQQNARLYRMFAPYMESLQVGPGADGRVRAGQHKQKSRKNGRVRQQCGSSDAQGDLQAMNYTALATERDPLAHLLSRHGFWGEAMTRL